VAVVRALGAREERQVSALLFQFLGEREREVTVAAAQELAHTRHAEVVPQMLEFIRKCRDDLLVVELVRTLAEIGDPLAVEPICGMLRSDGAGGMLRTRAALRALKQLNRRSAVKHLIRFLLEIFPPAKVRINKTLFPQFDWDKFEELRKPLTECLAQIAGVRHEDYEDWLSWYNKEGKDLTD
jgi:hypothetical protein